MHHLFAKNLPSQIFAPRPESKFDKDEDDKSILQRDVQSVRELLEVNHDEIAAIILEPIVQGAGGMRFYNPAYLTAIRDLCDEHHVLLIADEIATGFGRTGKLFACEHANISPDILCIGKALSGGFLSFAATLTTAKISQKFAQGEAGVFMHGPTFMGNPLACAVSLASLDLLQSYDWESKVQSIENQLKTELEPCRESPLVQDVRVLGAIGVVEMKEAFEMRKVQAAVVNEGVWLRPFGRLLYTMPPFIIQPSELRKITSSMVSIAKRRFR
jgi:adenosylmethionine-8-amino-7-oxononanoate aminotransferase